MYELRCMYVNKHVLTSTARRIHRETYCRNFKSKPLISGLQVHDTCNSEELTQKHLYHIISTTREAASVIRLKTPTGPPLLGMIGIGEPATLTETTGALHAFNIPLISVTPHPTGPSYSNVLTTAPDMAGQARVRFQNHTKFE